MILSEQTIKKLCTESTYSMITPFVSEKLIFNGLSYGLDTASYDIRLKQTIDLAPGLFCLGSSIERFIMPNDVMGKVHDKSAPARKGLSVFNTVIKPGWEGWLTIELHNTSNNRLVLPEGCPIAQVVFHRLDEPVQNPYRGKYNKQKNEPVEAKFQDGTMGF